jgi:hypothetical protein
MGLSSQKPFETAGRVEELARELAHVLPGAAGSEHQGDEIGVTEAGEVEGEGTFAKIEHVPGDCIVRARAQIDGNGSNERPAAALPPLADGRRFVVLEATAWTKPFHGIRRNAPW